MEIVIEHSLSAYHKVGFALNSTNLITRSRVTKRTSSKSVAQQEVEIYQENKTHTPRYVQCVILSLIVLKRETRGAYFVGPAAVDGRRGKKHDAPGTAVAGQWGGGDEKTPLAACAAPRRRKPRAGARRPQYDRQTGSWWPTRAFADAGRRATGRRGAEHGRRAKKRPANPAPGRRYRRKTVAGVWAERAAGGRAGDRLASDSGRAGGNAKRERERVRERVKEREKSHDGIVRRRPDGCAQMLPMSHEAANTRVRARVVFSSRPSRSPPPGPLGLLRDGLRRKEITLCRRSAPPLAYVPEHFRSETSFIISFFLFLSIFIFYSERSAKRSTTFLKKKFGHQVRAEFYHRIYPKFEYVLTMTLVDNHQRGDTYSIYVKAVHYQNLKNDCTNTIYFIFYYNDLKRF